MRATVMTNKVSEGVCGVVVAAKSHVTANQTSYLRIQNIIDTNIMALHVFWTVLTM